MGRDVQSAFSPTLILAVLVVTMLGFAGATFYVQRVAGTVDEDAVNIATDAAPGIQHLAAARGELTQLAIVLASLANGAAGPFDPALVTAPLARVRDELVAYGLLPFYPHEDRQYLELQRALADLEARTSNPAALAGAGPGAHEAVRAVLASVDRVDAAVARLVGVNVEQLRQRGMEIPLRRQHAHSLGYLLQGVTAVFGLVWMGLAIRGIKNYGRLLARARAATLARDDLLATVSHDLRNPLHAIALSTAALRRASPGPRMGQLTTRIERSVERMNRLIQDLLDAAKIEAGGLRLERHAEDPASMVAAAMDLFGAIAAEKTLRLIARAAPDCPPVLCERHQILRVLSNLVSNAVKFSPGGAAIVIAAEPVPGGVRFSVADEGPGIPPEHRALVFERYWQEQRGDRRGSGLGLFISRALVEAHGGRIWVEPTQGRGATISFALPVAPTARPRDTPA